MSMGVRHFTAHTSLGNVGGMRGRAAALAATARLRGLADGPSSKIGHGGIAAETKQTVGGVLTANVVVLALKNIVPVSGNTLAQMRRSAIYIYIYIYIGNTFANPVCGGCLEHECP